MAAPMSDTPMMEAIFSGHLGAAHRAGTHYGGARKDRIGVGRAAREAAGAAVGPGHDFHEQLFAGVLIHGKDLGGQSQNQAEQQAQAAQDGNGDEDCF